MTQRLRLGSGKPATAEVSTGVGRGARSGRAGAGGTPAPLLSGAHSPESGNPRSWRSATQEEQKAHRAGARQSKGGVPGRSLDLNVFYF